MIYRLLRFLFTISLQIFFRRIEVEGRENVPAAGPVILVPNHPNALVDALVILINVKRPVALTAKSTLADNLLLRLLMDATHVIRLHRKQDRDAGADRSRNVDALAECHRRLAAGGVIMIFPEGQSHSDPSLRPFRWGAAKLALQCVAGEQSVPVRIVPVGLHFPGKERFRNDVWIRFGKAVNATEWKEENPGGDARELTAHIEESVKGLTLNFERRSDEILMNWAARLLVTGGRPPRLVRQGQPAASRYLSVAGVISAGYLKLRAHRERELRELRRRIRTYRAELGRLGIAPEEVFILMDPLLAIRFVCREAVVLVPALPLALWGVLNHALPATATWLVERTLTRERDQVASNTIFPAILFFPLFYAVVVPAAWLWLPPVWAAAYAISLPYCGFLAVLYFDRAGRAWLRARTFLRFRKNPGLKERLEREGVDLIEALLRLGEELEKNTGHPPP